MLLDSFNRVIDYIRISITDRCNLRCKYCVNGAFPFIPHEEILSFEEIIRFMDITAQLGIKKVRLTGGEPLVRKGAADLFGALKKIEGIEDISLTTNGVFLGEKIMELKESGLKRVNISLDSLKRERFSFITGIDAMDNVFMSIEKCIYTGIRPIKINVVIIRGFNDDEILDFARLARTWGLEVRFIEFMPFGNEGMWDSSKIIPSSEIEGLIRTRFDLTPLKKTHGGPAKMFTVDDSKGKVGFISPVSSHICSECNRIRLTANGMLRPCLFSETEYDVKRLLRGNATDEDIRDFVRDVVDRKPQKKPTMGQVRKCQLSLRNIGG